MPVHLQNEQNVIFREGFEREALARSDTRKTKLDGFFELNRLHSEARQYLYSEIPLYYTWKTDSHEWSARVRGSPKVIGRIYNISPKQEELFYLRMLLLHVPGVQSYEDLYLVNGVRQNSFKMACLARGLLEDDQLWINTLTEAASYQMPVQMRQLFVTILANNEIAQPLILWVKFKKDMYQDFFHQYRGRAQQEEHAEQLCLLELEKLFKLINRSCLSYGLPIPVNIPPTFSNFKDGSLRTNQQNSELASRNIPLLNEGQKKVFDIIIQAATSNIPVRNNCFFIDGPAGTGKTFVQTVFTI